MTRQKPSGRVTMPRWPVPARTTWRAERGTTTLTFTGVQTGKVATVRVR